MSGYGQTARHQPWAHEAAHGWDEAATAAPTREQEISPRVQQLLLDYLLAIEEARRHEAQALARLKSALAGEHDAAAIARVHQVAAAAMAAPVGDAPTRRQLPIVPRLPLIAACAIVVLAAGGWTLLGLDAGTAGPGTHARHAGHAAHGGSHAEEPVRLAPGHQIAVELGEFFVTTDYNKVRGGDITFTIANSGTAEHELMIANADELPPDQVARLSASEVHERVLAFEHGVMPGAAQVELTANLEPGRYLLFCKLPGHFEQGQHAVLRVA